MKTTVSDVRPSPLAGQWYPGQADALRTMIDRFLETAHRQHKPEAPGQGHLLGLLAPHAGLRYSGPVAAHAFAGVQDLAFDSVVVAGPLHYPLPGVILTTAHTHYETPLGSIPVDREALDRLEAFVPLTRLTNDPEHSVEIELPFLQHVLKPGFTLVPLMLRDQSEARAEALGNALAEVLRGRNVLFVASSDLSHFYPQPVANDYDHKMLDRVAAMDAEKVVAYNEAGIAFACGAGAIAAVLHAIRAWDAESAPGEAPRATIVNYATSGDVTGDYARVVGYGAATFTFSQPN